MRHYGACARRRASLKAGRSARARGRPSSSVVLTRSSGEKICHAVSCFHVQRAGVASSVLRVQCESRPAFFFRMGKCARRGWRRWRQVVVAVSKPAPALCGTGCCGGGWESGRRIALRRGASRTLVNEWLIWGVAGDKRGYWCCGLCVWRIWWLISFELLISMIYDGYHHGYIIICWRSVITNMKIFLNSFANSTWKCWDTVSVTHIRGRARRPKTNFFYIFKKDWT